MTPTPVSLLERLKSPDSDQCDWNRLHDIYTPMVNRWLKRIPGVSNDATDLTQDVLLILINKVPEFDRRGDGAFRGWLRTITLHRAYKYLRDKGRSGARNVEAVAFLDQLADPSSELSKQWDRDHDDYILQNLLKTVQADFNERTWQAFSQFALQGVPARDVAETLGMTENAVIQAKSRVLSRLRHEADGLLD